MHIKLTLRNYRGFTQGDSAEFEISPGLVSIVGKNNAGKSTCIRALFELRPHLANYPYWVGTVSSPIDLSIQSEPDPTVVLNFANDDPAFVSIEIDPDITDGPKRLFKSTIQINRTGKALLHSICIRTEFGDKEGRLPFSGSGEIQNAELAYPAVRLSGEFGSYDFSAKSFCKSLEILRSCVYYGPYRNAINQGAAQYFDLAVGTALIGQWDNWKAGTVLANKRAIAKVESDIARLIGCSSVEINASSDNQTLDVKVDKHPFKLADLGAGVSELVITLTNALITKPSYVLIDEPESHLHPSLQMDFLTTLASYTKYGVIFATHSIGLARSVSDRVYVVTKNQQGAQLRRYEQHPRLAELLGNLSYSGHFPFGHAKVLLVEGSTEVRTLQILLRKLGKDHHYVILPLGGTQLIRSGSDVELAEVVRVAGSSENVFALVDSERQSKDAQLSKEREAFGKTCLDLGITCHLTKRRATENYFSPEAIKKTLGESYEALGHFDSLQSQENGWAKSHNWRIADRESERFFDEHDLGQFLKALPT